MTIAGVYLSPEGVVLGADSTSSVASNQGFHFYDFNQKLFEIGEDGTLGLLTWGLGGLGVVSYRTLLAEFADELAATPATTVTEVAQRWTDKFWQAYSSYDLVIRVQHLIQKQQAGLTPQEQDELNTLSQSLSVGFCIAGYVLPNRTPEAHSIDFSPFAGKPTPNNMAQHSLQWWGVPNFFNRLLVGADNSVLASILGSGKWQGSQAELQSIVSAHTIVPNGTLPIRDAVDYVHTCIFCTIKAIKFSGLPQVCGGPIELAVITSDRKFRWVRHKQWDAAILDGAL